MPPVLTDWQVFPSPDEQLLILIGKDWNERNEHHIYAYYLEENELTLIETLQQGYDKNWHLCDWFNNTQGILCLFSPYHYLSGSYYSFDLSQPNSLNHLFAGYQDTVIRLENPLRYVAMYSEDFFANRSGSRGSKHRPCQITIYDAEHLIRQDISYECIPLLSTPLDNSLFYQQGDVIYFLSVENEDSTVSTFHNLNIRTLTSLEMPAFSLSGEYESIISVSPDGRYIVLLLDDNGELDFNWHPNGCCFPSDGWQVGILDTIAGRFVYRSQPIGVYTSEHVVWLDNHNVVITAQSEREMIRASETGIYFLPIPASLRRITLYDDGTYDETITTRYGLERGRSIDSLIASPTTHYWIVDGNIIIDLRTLQPIPIVQDDPIERVTFSGKIDENGILQVRVFHPTDSSRYVDYDVTLP